MTPRAIHLCGQAIDQPGHICAFFDSRDEEYDTLIPYLRDGIENGERVLNVLDEERLADHYSRLEAGGMPTGDGRLLVAASEETYLAGGQFEMEHMVDFVRETLANAAADGRRVRTAGWMDWIGRGAPGTDRVMEYEARMNLLFPDFDCTFMCVYNRALIDDKTFIDIMATHPYVILNGEIRKNAVYVPPEIYLKDVLAPLNGGRPRTDGNGAS